MYSASIQFTKTYIPSKTYRHECIAEDFNGNHIAVTGSPRVCGDPISARLPTIQLLLTFQLFSSIELLLTL